MISVSTNTLALISQRHEKTASSALSTSIERLSSGLRINSAKDDAAGIAIANRMTSSIRGLAQASRNTNDGVSMSQTAQGFLDDINSRLQRIRELAVQGLNEIYNGDVGDAIQAEINLNLKEIDRLNRIASFNGMPLLDGSTGTKHLQVGSNGGDTLPMDFGPPGFSIEELGLLDLYIQGRPGKITHVSTLSGSSHSIDLDDAARTSVSYVPSGGSPNLVRPSHPGSRAVIQLDDDGGRLREVRTTATYDTDAKASTVRLDVQNPAVVLTARESVSTWEYLDENGNALSLSQAELVSSGGRYWIKHQSSGAPFFYEAELTIHGDQHKITAQAKGSVPIAEAAMPGSISPHLRSAPAVTLATADYALTVDGTDEVGNPNMQLVHVGGYYYVEEELPSGQYAYYKADVTIKTGGAQNDVAVTANRGNAITVSDEKYVTGSTTAHLKPDNNNIQVNYIDLQGQAFTNVMRDDGQGGYHFVLDDASSKTAKVVTNEQGRYMLQTMNGTGDVILYYPLYTEHADGSYTNSFTVSSNAENDFTTITLREADIAERLRTPPEPLAAIDEAIARVDAKRGEFGALDNRLQSIIQMNSATGVNLTTARSRIEDADYAVETANMTRAQILQQASTSLLAQANENPRTVLSLLKQHD